MVGWLGQPDENQQQLASVTPSQKISEPGTPEASRFAEQPVAAPSVPERGEETWIKASPIARNMAREHGLNLARIKGSGPEGRVMEKDVREAIAALSVLEKGKSISIPASDLHTISAVRSTTARRMVASFQTAPHFYLQVEILAERLVDLRAQLLKDGQGGSVSYTALFARALALTLSVHPLLNASWEDGKVRVFKETHLGIAVAVPQGLVVPVIHRAETLTIWQLNKQITRMA